MLIPLEDCRPTWSPWSDATALAGFAMMMMTSACWNDGLRALTSLGSNLGLERVFQLE